MGVAISKKVDGAWLRPKTMLEPQTGTEVLSTTTGLSPWPVSPNTQEMLGHTATLFGDPWISMGDKDFQLPGRTQSTLTDPGPNDKEYQWPPHLHLVPVGSSERFGTGNASCRWPQWRQWPRGAFQSCWQQTFLQGAAAGARAPWTPHVGSNDCSEATLKQVPQITGEIQRGYLAVGKYFFSENTTCYY